MRKGCEQEHEKLCALLTDSYSRYRQAFSNPRMSLKWAKAEKVSLLGEDLLSKG